MRDLKAIGEQCMYDLDLLGIPYREVSRWVVNTRAKSRWGQCKRLPNGTFEININEDLLREENSLEGLRETIMHELLHTCEGCMNHKSKWTAYARQVNNAYNLHISRTTSAENIGVSIRDDGYKYMITCNQCGLSWKFRRSCSTTEAVLDERAKCPCGSKSFQFRYL